MIWSWPDVTPSICVSLNTFKRKLDTSVEQLRDEHSPAPLWFVMLVPSTDVPTYLPKWQEELCLRVWRPTDLHSCGNVISDGDGVADMDWTAVTGRVTSLQMSVKTACRQTVVYYAEQCVKTVDSVWDLGPPSKLLYAAVEYSSIRAVNCLTVM